MTVPTSEKASIAGVLAALTLVAGCALTPRGLSAERERLQSAGAAIARPDPATFPVPAGGDDWRTLLRRALVANDDLRADWYEWKSAVEKVRGASGWPNTNATFGYSYLFSDQSVKSFDRSTFSAGFDGMENLSFPGKTMAAGRIALGEARAAGEKFRAQKFKLQRTVIESWLELAMAAESRRIAERSRTLAEVGSDVADAALRTGGGQAEALQARMQSARAADEVAAADAKIASAKATLAALAAFDDSDRVATPTRLPDPRELPADATVLLHAADDGPAVLGLRADADARDDAEDLARLQWIPDINPAATFTGGAEQMIGAVIVLPTTIAEIRSGIASAKAMRKAASYRIAQGARDKRGEVEAALIAAASDERVRRLLEQKILPDATSAATAAESMYATGGAKLGDLVEARALLLDTRKEIAESAIDREKQLAAIEEVLGADLETFTAPAIHLAAASAIDPAAGRQSRAGAAAGTNERAMLADAKATRRRVEVPR